ncbi:hypothetical protein ACVBEG_27585 [Pseudomonas sp. GG8]
MLLAVVDGASGANWPGPEVVEGDVFIDRLDEFKEAGAGYGCGGYTDLAALVD